VRRARVLIAGCGDLGMRTAARLACDARILSVHGLRRNPPPIADGAIEWVKGDLADPSTLDALPEDITHLLYTPTPGARDPRAYQRVFVEGLRNLQACPALKSLQRLVFVSSSAVYGDHDGNWIDEETPVDPQGFNGRILLEAESRLLEWGASLGASACVLRLAGLYGPGRTQLLDRLRQGLARAPIAPAHWANRIHIDDAAHACATLLMLDSVAPCYLGCDDTPLPLHELYASLAEHIGAPPVAVGPAPFGVGSKRMCNARLRSTGWSPAYPDARSGYFRVDEPK